MMGAAVDAGSFRDPAGRVWLQIASAAGEDYWAFEPSQQRWQLVVRGQRPHGRARGYVFLDWIGAEHALFQHGTRIVRVEIQNGDQLQLFPRRP